MSMSERLVSKLLFPHSAPQTTVVKRTAFLSAGPFTSSPYAIGGSGSTYIYGFCDSNWKEGMEEADAVAFVKEALKEAIKWDGSSGGVIRMVVLTAKGADKHLYLPDTDYKVRHAV
ncbi:hypothetical protein B0T16DRAFT_452495 [Cercophora newfieldiana]|uniref:proteasome endopeptidase complex n=1 Tax=Cercophora newfieldiana TaxID=92897 RepID=A0AA40D0A0_9PEZI|nr:hypothetical protein B0T16DRAFT_452495 [Cercophora newfieldiana]